MAELVNTNLRGIRISPAGKSDTVNYYVCVIDQPQGSNFDPSQVTIIEPTEGDTTLKYSYNGTLQDPASGDLVWTFVLPVYTNQKIARDHYLHVEISDNSPEANFAKGNPNQGRPPVTQPVDGQHDLTTNFVFLKCQTGESSQTLIMGAIVNTNFYLADGSTLSNGGYANSFVINVDSENSVLNATLVGKDKGPVASFGIVSCMGDWQFYSSITINAGGQSKTTTVEIPESWHSF